MIVHTFTAEGTSDDVQAAIDNGGGTLTVTVPWQHTRGYENADPGDGAVIEVADPDDKSCWLGDVLDVEHEDGYPMTVLIDIR
jgi:hypothetical protein